jgi:ketosteroid isomerase-like protein
MSQENFEVVRRSIEAWNRRDVATWLAVFSSDAEIDWSRARGPFKGVYRGRGKQEAFWDVFWSTFEDINSSSATFAEAGSEVVVSNTAYMQGRDGIEVIARAALVYTVENGQITRLRMFQERAEALEAAGLKSHHHPDVEWRDPPELPDAGVHHGVGGIRRFFADLLETGDEWHVEVEDVSSVGPQRVLMQGRSVGVGRGSRIPIEDPFFQLFDLDKGRVRRVQTFRSDTEALEAAGLSE